jgi:hypothetical protein
MNKGTYNRPIVITVLLSLGGWIAYLMAAHNLEASNAAFIFGGACSIVATYVGVKGKGVYKL